MNEETYCHRCERITQHDVVVIQTQSRKVKCKTYGTEKWLK